MSKKNWVMVHITVFQVEWTELWGKEESSIWFWVFSIRYGIDRWQHHFTYIRFGGNKSTKLPGRKFRLDTYMYGSCAHEQGREVVFLRLVSLGRFLHMKFLKNAVRISIFGGGMVKDRGGLWTTVAKKACANLWRAPELAEPLQAVPHSDKELKVNLYQPVIGDRLQILSWLALLRHIPSTGSVSLENYWVLTPLVAERLSASVLREEGDLGSRPQHPPLVLPWC